LKKCFIKLKNKEVPVKYIEDKLIQNLTGFNNVKPKLLKLKSSKVLDVVREFLKINKDF